MQRSAHNLNLALLATISFLSPACLVDVTPLAPDVDAMITRCSTENEICDPTPDHGLRVAHDAGATPDLFIAQEVSLQDAIVSDRQLEPVCGNGTVEAGEICDDGSANGADCPYGDVGCQTCSEDCAQLVNTARFCGDGIVDPEESCDEPEGTSAVCLDEGMLCTICNEMCELVTVMRPSCGDGIIGTEEECDDGNEDPEDGCNDCRINLSATISLENAAYAYRHSVCSFADRCDRRIPLELFANESCETFAVDVFNEQVLGYLQGDLALTFSEDKMSSCARFIQDADCDEDVFELLTACNSRRHDEHFILDGQLDFGAPCRHSYECGTDFQCLITNECPGRCDLLGNRSSPCSFASDCRSGLTCFNGGCVPPRERNDRCGENYPACRDDFVCLPQGFDDELLCKRPPSNLSTEGERCDLTSGRFCEPNLSCVEKVIVLGVFECESLSGPNERCHLGFPDQCETGYFCEGATLQNRDSQCRPLPTVGQPCGEAWLSQVCGQGLVCVDDVCIPKAPLGELCSVDVMCHSGACRNDRCDLPQPACTPSE